MSTVAGESPRTRGGEVKVGHIAALKLSQTGCTVIVLGVNNGAGLDKRHKGNGGSHRTRRPASYQSGRRRVLLLHSRGLAH